MQKILLILVLIFLESSLNAQGIKFKKDDKYGIVNKGDTLVQPVYDLIKKQEDGYFVVWEFGDSGAIDGNTGTIDYLGNVIIPMKYEAVKYIGDDLFIVGYRAKKILDYHLGVVKKGNKEILPIKFDGIKRSGNNLLVRTKTDSILDTKRDRNNTRYYNTRSKKKYGFYDKSGKNILPVEYADISELNNGLHIIKKDSLYALFSKDLKRLTEFEYDYVSEYFDGLAKVNKNGLIGYINKLGEEQIKPQYEKGWNFIEGVTRVNQKGKIITIDSVGKFKTKGKTIIIDSVGNKISNIKNFNVASLPNNNQVIIKKRDSLGNSFNKNYGIADLDGNILLSADYNYVRAEYKGAAFFKKDGNWQLWDFNKKKLLPKKYQHVIIAERRMKEVRHRGITVDKIYSDSLALVKNDNDEWAVINGKGALIEPFQKNYRKLYKEYVVK